MELYYIDINLNKIILHFEELLQDLNPLLNDIDGIKIIDLADKAKNN
jgi:hypothetical protein